MGFVLWIGLGVAGACAVVLLDSVVADVLGGEIELDSSSGNGTSLRVAIPGDG